MRKANKRLFGIIFFVFCLAVLKVDVKAESAEEARILSGVFIDSVDVSEMTREQAVQAVEKHLDEIKGYNIQLQAADQSVSVTAGELGLSWDSDTILDNALEFGQHGNIVKRYKAQKDVKEEPIRLSLYYTVDRDKLKAVIEARSADFNREPVNASMQRADGGFTIEKDQSGITVNVEESISLVEDYLTNLWRYG